LTATPPPAPTTPATTLSLPQTPEGKAKAAAKASDVAADLSDVFIDGATGLYSHVINGLYKPLSSLRSKDGWVMYGRSTDSGNICIDHRDGFWVIRPLSSWNHMYARVAGGCDLQLCKFRTWSVFVDAKDCRVQPSVRLTAGPLAHVHRDNYQAQNIFICGFSGKSVAANGLYMPSEERSTDERIVYCNDSGCCIEHDKGVWGISLMSLRGTGRHLAFISGNCALESISGAVHWRVWNEQGQGYKKDVRVNMTSGYQADLCSKATGFSISTVQKLIVDGTYFPAQMLKNGRMVFCHSENPSLTIESSVGSVLNDWYFFDSGQHLEYEGSHIRMYCYSFELEDLRESHTARFYQFRSHEIIAEIDIFVKPISELQVIPHIN
jgi:hypothetical protein